MSKNTETVDKLKTAVRYDYGVLIRNIITADENARFEQVKIDKLNKDAVKLKEIADGCCELLDNENLTAKDIRTLVEIVDTCLKSFSMTTVNVILGSWFDNTESRQKADALHSQYNVLKNKYSKLKPN